MDDIKSYDPFYVEFISYDGSFVTVTFTCPFCGSHSCRRSIYCNSNHFFEGQFRCLKCNAGSLNKEPFNYYSPCFILHRDSFTQLSLF